jgi:hypothetical protein
MMKASNVKIKIGEFVLVTLREPPCRSPRKPHHYKTHGWIKDEARELKSKNRVVKMNKKNIKRNISNIKSKQKD